MEWLFAFVVLFLVAGIAEDIHNKWHKRQMLDPQKKGSNVYA